MKDRRTHTKVAMADAPKFFELEKTLTSAPFISYTVAMFVAFLGLFTREFSEFLPYPC